MTTTHRTSSHRLAAALGAVALALVLVGCGGETDTPPATSPPATSPHATSAPATSSATAGGSRTPVRSVTKDEAGRIATDKYGGTVINVESDHYRGQAAWEVEVRDSRQGRIEVKVAKATGEVLHMEHED